MGRGRAVSGEGEDRAGQLEAGQLERLELERVIVLQDGANSMSWHYPAPGVCEIIHVEGRFKVCAGEFAAAFGAELRAAGAHDLTWRGRNGWPRFLERVT